MIPSCCYTNKSVQCFNPCYIQCASRSVTYSNPCSPCTYTYDCSPCAPRKSCLRVCSLPRQYSSCSYEADECPKRRSSSRLSASSGIASVAPPAPREPRAKSKKRNSTNSERRSSVQSRQSTGSRESKKSDKPRGGGKLKVTSEGKVKIAGGKGGTKIDTTNKCEVSRENPAHPSKNVNISTEDTVNVITATDDEDVDIASKAQIEMDSTGSAESVTGKGKRDKKHISRSSATDDTLIPPQKNMSKTNSIRKQSRGSGSNSRIEARSYSKISQTGTHPVRSQASGNTLHTLYPPTQQTGYGAPPDRRLTPPQPAPYPYPPQGGYPPQMGYPPQNGYPQNYGYPPPCPPCVPCPPCRPPAPCQRPLTQTNIPPVSTSTNNNKTSKGVMRPSQCYCEDGNGSDNTCNVTNCPYIDGEEINDELCISILLKMDQKTFDSLMDLGCSLTPNLKFCKTCGAIKVDPVVIPISSTKGEPEVKTCKVECKANCAGCPKRRKEVENKA